MLLFITQEQCIVIYLQSLELMSQDKHIFKNKNKKSYRDSLITFSCLCFFMGSFWFLGFFFQMLLNFQSIYFIVIGWLHEALPFQLDFDGR